jgi:hypothetical protein
MPPTIFAELDSDWATLAESAAATTALRRWRREEPALAPFSTMAELVQAAHRRGAPAECDRILVALARRAGSDGLAARTLLQTLLPGARALAWRLWWLGGPEERAAAVVGALYERIRTYPFARRPAKVAANALADVPIGELGRREGLEAHSMRRRRQRAERRLAVAVAGRAEADHGQDGRVPTAACA